MLKMMNLLVLVLLVLVVVVACRSVGSSISGGSGSKW